MRLVCPLHHRPNLKFLGEFIEFNQKVVSWLSERHFRKNTISARICTWLKEQQRRKTWVKKSEAASLWRFESIKRYSFSLPLGLGVRVDLWRCQENFLVLFYPVFQIYGNVSCTKNNVKSALILREVDLVSRSSRSKTVYDRPTSNMLDQAATNWRPFPVV